MYLLLTILFTIKLYPHIDIFKINKFILLLRKDEYMDSYKGFDET